MANNAYLINSAIFSNSIEELNEKGEKFTILATGSNRIPVPWFFGFDHDDLKPAEFHSKEDSGEKVSFKFQAPCATQEKVLSNIVLSKELFIQFCGDETLGEQYWAKAVADLENLEYPYISLHPLEVFYLNDPEEEAVEFNKSFTRTAKSFPSIELLSFYQKGHLPYDLIEFYADPNLSDQNRRKNSAALDMGIKGVDTSSWIKQKASSVPAPENELAANLIKSKPANQTNKPWWRIW